MRRLRELLATDTGRATLLTGAQMGANVIALAFTIVFSHLLGEAYGTLVVLLAAFLILSVPGQALQTAVAREISRAAAAGEPDPLANIWRWLRALLVLTGVATVVSVAVTAAFAPSPGPFAGAIGIDEEWAAATVLPAAGAWLILCVERGALQGVRRYGLVSMSLIGEASSRLAIGLAFYALGAGVTGAFMGTLGAVVVVGLALAPVLAAHHGPHADHGGLGSLLRLARMPLIGLALFAVLQNLDVIVVQHLANKAAASSYGAAAIAAKAVVWVAVGIGLFLLPEAVRRTHEGRDARPILLKSVGLIALVALPMLAIFTFAGEPFLKLVFGEERASASPALPWLGLAMTLLALSYLGLQYLLALHDNVFLALLGVAAVVQPIVLVVIGETTDADLRSIALGLTAVLAALAVAMLGFSFKDAGSHVGVPAPDAEPALE